ncbi:MAG: carbonic anhydrase [Gemmataceae bacterium]
MTRIIQGVMDFQRKVFGKKKALFQELGKGQTPLALFITCSDSRIMPDMLAQTEPGELFVLRNAGNIVPPFSSQGGAEAATIEYAVMQLRVRDIILCGHSKCGAMHGLLEPHGLEKLPSVASWINHSKSILPNLEKESGSIEDRLAVAIEQNVLLQLENLKTHPSVQQALKSRDLRLHGWVYHFESGKVDRYDPLQGKFAPLESHFHEKLLDHADKDSKPRTVWDTHI